MRKRTRHSTKSPNPSKSSTIFRRVEYIPDIVEAAIRRNARVIWMQQGLIHDAAAARARSAGLEVVMNRCILVEHMQHF